jgi:quinol monooxygenase YgiN
VILEHALLEVTPGREAAFEAAMAEALAIIEADPGCRGAEVRRQHENPSTYLLLVRWMSVAAHLEGFRTSAAFERWRELTHPFYAQRPLVTHFGAPIARADAPGQLG